MAARTCAEVPADGIVFFGIRGALPLDLSGTPFAERHSIRLTEFNHVQMRCTLGQWRPAERVLALFPGSTVPRRTAVATAKAKSGIGANMLMLGRYRYRTGIHNADSKDGHRAFRQAVFFPVWRTSDDLDYDLDDWADLGGKNQTFVWDNLHCAFHDNIDTPGFSSNGCQVVAGHPRSARRANKPETGPWARFIENCYGRGGNGQQSFTYLLFAGAEAGMVADASRKLSRSLRFGSSGEWVTIVQKALQGEGFDFLTPDGDFGRNTLEAVMAFQAREFGRGRADGIVGANTAAALGLDWDGTGQPLSGTAEAAAALKTREISPPTAVPTDWHASATKITPGFEVSGDPYEGVSGDFDRMGISCGALQWNIGKGSLQPMVVAVGSDVVRAAMPQLGSQMWSACTSPLQVGLGIVRSWQSGTKLTPPAKAELRKLMGTAEMRAEQDRRIAKVAERAFALADKWAQSGGKDGPSKREFLWFFDLVTQNGSLEGITRRHVENFIALNAPGRADDAICDYLAGLSGTSGHIRDAHKNAALWRNQADAEKLELLVLSYLRSGSADARWRHVVLNRKGSIAMGGGWVNSGNYSFASHGI
jgi:hypothetical protein